MPFTEDQVKGKTILVIEDIFDSGSTIMRTRESLLSFGPADLRFSTIFHKKNPKNLKHSFFADYIGFIIPDFFVIGYGMDYNELFREMSHLCVISQEGIDAFKDMK